MLRHSPKRWSSVSHLGNQRDCEPKTVCSARAAFISRIPAHLLCHGQNGHGHVHLVHLPNHIPLQIQAASASIRQEMVCQGALRPRAGPWICEEFALERTLTRSPDMAMLQQKTCNRHGRSPMLLLEKNVSTEFVLLAGSRRLSCARLVHLEAPSTRLRWLEASPPSRRLWLQSRPSNFQHSANWCPSPSPALQQYCNRKTRRNRGVLLRQRLAALHAAIPTLMPRAPGKRQQFSNLAW